MYIVTPALYSNHAFCNNSCVVNLSFRCNLLAYSAISNSFNKPNGAIHVFGSPTYPYKANKTNSFRKKINQNGLISL
jgi:hypothetical protein